MDSKAYVGTGSRQIPSDVHMLMRRIAAHLAARQYSLRTGGAAGADRAFEQGCGSGAKQIYLPSPRYGGHTSPFVMTEERMVRVLAHEVWHLLHDWLAAETPAIQLDAQPRSVQQIYAAQVYMVLGDTLLDVPERLICWTPNAERVGETRIAMYVALWLSVDIHNLADLATFSRWQQFLATSSVAVAQ